MRYRNLLATWVAAIVFANATFAAAQSNTEQPSEHPILDRIDGFGRSLFGGGDAKERSQRAATARANAARASSSRAATQNERVARANPPADRIVERSADVGVTRPTRVGGVWSGEALGTPNDTVAVPAVPAERPAAERPAAERAHQPVLRPATETTDSASAIAPKTTIPASSRTADDFDNRTVMRPSGANALHQRLSGFRQSAFGDESPPPQVPSGPQGAAALLDSNPAGGAGAARQGNAADTPSVRVAAAPREESTLAPMPRPSSVGARATAVGSSAGTNTNPSGRASSGTSAVTPWGSSNATAGDATSGYTTPGYTGIRAAPSVGAPAVAGSAAGENLRNESSESAGGNVAAAGSGSKPNGEGVLFTRQSPVIHVETIGSRKISVGKESAYEIIVRNAGAVAAEQVVVMIDLPDWTDVLAAEASTGSTSSEKPKDGIGEFRWKVGRIEAKARERLVLRIIPRQNRPFDLAVRWGHSPASSQATIEVQEAKLNLTLQGPREVLYGKGELYRLEVANSGNGDAENIVISLLPSTPGDKQPPASYRLGTVASGQKKTIDIELTARQTGDLLINVEARGDADIKAQLAEKILVRRGALKIDVEAPKIQFVGSDATYRVRVSNPGTAPAVNPTITAIIPAGTKFLGSPQKPQIASDRSRVTWMLETLPPGGETTVTMSCDATTPGVSKLEVQAAAEGDLNASNTASTQVEAIASLTLKVDDPTGPVALETEAAYLLNIENRGTAAAEGIEVIGYFTKGFEPVGAEGGRYRINSGQIVFERIASLGAGQSAPLKIRAKATAPGNHIFRVEVRSELGTRLVREGTTRFYGDPAAAGASRAVAQPAASQPGALQPGALQPGATPGLQPGTTPAAEPDRTAARPETAVHPEPASPPVRDVPNDPQPKSR